MTGTLHAFDYLDQSKLEIPPAVCVVFGDEPFLKRLVLQRIRSLVIEDEDTPFATFDGVEAQWRDVADELSTIALFGGGSKRLAIIDEADDFISANRDRLETYVEKPRSGGVLVLNVGTWAANTRLYKSVDKTGLQIDCRAPKRSAKSKEIDGRRVLDWLTKWGVQHHDAKLSSQGGQLLLELVGADFGRLDQELAKLALFVGSGGTIKPELVQDVVGGWKTKTVWELMDAACAGDAGEALTHLDHALQAGEAPQALFGQISWSLRRFAAATRIFEQSERSGQRIPLSQALLKAGFRQWPKDAISKAEAQLKQLGRERAGKLYQWLLEADLALKGSHSTPHRARFMIEQLLLRLANDAVSKAGRR